MPEQVTLNYIILAVLLPLVGILLRVIQSLYDRQLTKAEGQVKELTEGLTALKDAYKELTQEFRLWREGMQRSGGTVRSWGDD